MLRDEYVYFSPSASSRPQEGSLALKFDVGGRVGEFRSPDGYAQPVEAPRGTEAMGLGAGWRRRR